MKYYLRRNLGIRIFLYILISIFVLAILSCSSAPASVTQTNAALKTIPVNSSINNSPTSIIPTTEIPVDTVISVSIDQPNIKAGANFAANILIDTQTALRGAQWKINFDPKVMRCDKVTEGNFFKDWAAAHGGETLTFPQPKIDNTLGQVSDMGIAIMTSQEGGVSGSGIICTYNFTALTDAIEVPILSNVQMVDKNAKTVKATIKS